MSLASTMGFGTADFTSMNEIRFYSLWKNARCEAGFELTTAQWNTKSLSTRDHRGRLLFIILFFNLIFWIKWQKIYFLFKILNTTKHAWFIRILIFRNGFYYLIVSDFFTSFLFLVAGGIVNSSFSSLRALKVIALFAFWMCFCNVLVFGCKLCLLRRVNFINT